MLSIGAPEVRMISLGYLEGHKMDLVTSCNTLHLIYKLIIYFSQRKQRKLGMHNNLVFRQVVLILATREKIKQSKAIQLTDK